LQDDLKDASFSTSRLTRYLNKAQNLIFNTHYFRVTEKAFTGTLVDTNHTVAQQTDHQATIGGTLIDPDDTSRRVVLNERNYLPHRQFFETFPDPATETAGMPSHWTEFGQDVYFNCPADKDYTFNQRYYKTATVLSAAGDIPSVPEAFRDLLELFALHRASLPV
jgi:hypothetical protein